MPAGPVVGTVPAVSAVEVRPFEAADLTACGVLLADRHRRHRIAEPLLSPRFEDIGVATSELTGQAATDAEVIRDLYAVAAARWVDEGRTAHYVVVPAHDAQLVRAWFRLGFGQQRRVRHVRGRT